MNINSDHSVPALLSPPIQTAIRVLSGSAIALICLLSYWSSRQRIRPGAEPDIEPQHLFQIDINQADLREWTLMPQIGTLTAERIVQDRRDNGPFRSVNDLQRVPGIGAKTVREISPYCKKVTVAYASPPAQREDER